VVSVSLSDPTQVKAWATPSQGGGAWAPGGVASDGVHLFVATGNTQGTSATWGGGEAVLRFGVGAAFGALDTYFAPPNWPTLSAADNDLGTAPVLFDLPGSTPSALAIVFGKDGSAYLLDRNNLGGVGNALTTVKAATGQIISAPAVYTTATATYAVVKGAGALCTTGSGDLMALRIVPGSPPTIAGSWCAKAGAGSPIVTTTNGQDEAVVWNVGAEYDLRLRAFDGDTGAVLYTDPVSLPLLRRYNAPIAAKGRIFVAAEGSLVAYQP
jgi:hypothetical protein